MNAALYLRVSTQDQSLDNQLPDLERLAQARSLTIVQRFAEKAFAAKALLDCLLAEAQQVVVGIKAARKPRFP